MTSKIQMAPQLSCPANRQVFSILLVMHCIDMHWFGEEQYVALLQELAQSCGVSEHYRVAAVHIASMFGKGSVVRLLLTHGVPPDLYVEGQRRWNPLHAASSEGSLGLTKILLEGGASVNAQGVYAPPGRQPPAPCVAIRNTPLQLAAYYNNTGVAQMLLDYGATVDAVSQGTFPPLYSAAEHSNYYLARLLLDRGADPDGGQQWQGLTPLQFATIRKDWRLASLFVAHGADVNECRGFGAALHFAVWDGKLDFAEQLIAKGAKLDCTNQQQQTPLHWAARSGDLDMASLLLTNGAAVDAFDLAEWTPLHVAVHRTSMDMATLLLKCGAGVNKVDRELQSPLHLAVHNGSVPMTSLLLQHGAAMDKLDGKNQTPLHVAVHRGQLDLITLLLQNGAGVDTRDGRKRTPLHWAAHLASPDLTYILLRHGADVCVRDRHNQTPLHLAVRRREDLAARYAIAQLLVPKGAPIAGEESRDVYSYTPLAYVLATYKQHHKRHRIPLPFLCQAPTNTAEQVVARSLLNLLKNAAQGKLSGMQAAGYH